MSGREQSKIQTRKLFSFKGDVNQCKVDLWVYQNGIHNFSIIKWVSLNHGGPDPCQAADCGKGEIGPKPEQCKSWQLVSAKMVHQIYIFVLNSLGGNTPECR